MASKKFAVFCVTACLSGLIALLWMTCALAEKPRLKVGYLQINAALPLFVTLKEKLFETEGIVVEPVKYQNGALKSPWHFIPAATAALASESSQALYYRC